MKAIIVSEPDGLLLRQRSMESFFSPLKVEPLHSDVGQPARSRHDLFVYTDGYCYQRRIHSVRGYITPEEATRTAFTESEEDH